MPLVSEEDRSHGREAKSRSHRTDQQKLFPAELVDHRHCDHGELQVRQADDYRLQIARYFAESSIGKYVIQVIQNGVDARKLVEHSDRHGQEDWETILSGEQRLVGVSVLGIDRFNDFPQFFLVIFDTGKAQYLSGFVYSTLLCKPARASGNGDCLLYTS